MEALKPILLMYALMMFTGAAITFALWRVQRIQLLRKLSLIWFFLIACAAIQALWQGGPLGIVLAGATAYPTFFLMAELVGDLARLKFNCRTSHIFYGVSLLGVALTAVAGLGFTWMALPMAVGIAYPLLNTGVRALGSRTASFSVKALALVNVLSALHTLDFPFLRMVESFAPTGFTIATMIVFAFAIIAPLTIIEFQRDEFASLASHELKAPLTSLQLSASLLEQEAERDDIKALAVSSKLPRVAKTIDRQVQHLSRLADNLLCVSNMRAGLLHIKTESDVDLGAIVTEVAERLEVRLHESSGTIGRLQITSPEIGPKGSWDRFKLDLVVTNIISNALKYGGNKPVYIEVSNGSAGATLVVRDEGIGIDEESKSRVFGLYQRATSAKGYSGMGLGMYVAHQIVSLHGGELSFESALGRGTEFTMILPAATPRS